jgi:large subunit ribosomal protein L21
MTYAIFRTGGKQYRVKPGDVIDVDRLQAEEGSSVALSEVLAVSRDDEVVLGTPLVPDCSVVASVTAQDKDKKIVVFKYKRKVRYRRKKGHRQHYTRLAITSIVVGGEEIGVEEEPQLDAAVRRLAETRAEAEAETAEAVDQGEAIIEPVDEAVDEDVEEEAEAEAGVEVEEAQEEASDEPADDGEKEAEDVPVAEVTEEPPKKPRPRARKKASDAPQEGSET